MYLQTQKVIQTLTHRFGSSGFANVCRRSTTVPHKSAGELGCFSGDFTISGDSDMPDNESIHFLVLLPKSVIRQGFVLVVLCCMAGIYGVGVGICASTT